MKKLLCVILSLCVTFGETKIKALDLPTYRAGVVEFNPSNGTPKEITVKNLENYLTIINNAGKQSVDILIFPEATLNRDWQGSTPMDVAVVVPPETEKANPCEDQDKYSKILSEISCAALVENMYIVINVAEVANCNDTMNPNCTNGEKFMFNTNVVFDRNGTIISRYRKINLFGEKGFSESFGRELGMFETDFGVKFGHFICFDLMFQEPAVQIIERENITNIIFPTMWFSELPALTAVEIQQSWAFTHNVNLLAAGANNPHVGSTGTGIYSGKLGAIQATMSGLPKTELLVADVPKIPGALERVEKIQPKEPLEMDSLRLKVQNLTVYKSARIDETKESQSFELSFDRAACEFSVTINKNFVSSNENGTKQYLYRAIVFDGVRSFDFKNGGVIECAIVACTSDDLMSCGLRFPIYTDLKPTMEITSIEINAIVPRPIFNTSVEAYNIVYHPVTLLTNIYPLNINDFQYTISDTESDDLIKLNLKTDKPQSEYLMFGFFGRSFDNDNLPLTDASVTLCKFNYITLLLLGLITVAFATNHNV